MGILVLKTDIQDTGDLGLIRPVLNDHPDIRTWTVDTEDIDKVLRIEANESLSIEAVIQLVRELPIHCEELLD